MKYIVKICATELVVKIVDMVDGNLSNGDFKLSLVIKVKRLFMIFLSVSVGETI
jgi:hypothetical protein